MLIYCCVHLTGNDSGGLTDETNMETDNFVILRKLDKKKTYRIYNTPAEFYCCSGTVRGCCLRLYTIQTAVQKSPFPNEVQRSVSMSE